MSRGVKMGARRPVALQLLPVEGGAWEWNNRLCWYCGCRLRGREADRRQANRRTKDHVQPLSRGGSDTAENLVYACQGCNTEKRNLTLEEYRAQKGGGQFFGETCATRRPDRAAEHWTTSSGAVVAMTRGSGPPSAELAAAIEEMVRCVYAAEREEARARARWEDEGGSVFEAGGTNAPVLRLTAPFPTE